MRAVLPYTRIAPNAFTARQHRFAMQMPCLSYGKGPSFRPSVTPWTFRVEANIIMRRHEVPCGLSKDPKMSHLERP